MWNLYCKILLLFQLDSILDEFRYKKEDCVDLSEKIKLILDDECMMKMMECEAKKKYDEYYTLRCFEQNFKDCIANSI